MADISLVPGARQGHTLKLQIWFEDAGGEGFGRGRIRLLMLIDELGSLSKAAKQLGMSYRGAWGKLKKAEAVLGFALVEAAGSKRDGYRLSAAGKRLVEAYNGLFADAQAYVEHRASEIFPLTESAPAGDQARP